MIAARIRTAIALAATAAGIGSLTVLPPPAGATGERHAALPVSVSVLQISPSTPVPSVARTPFTITLSLTNTSARTLSNLHLQAQRGDPLGSQHELDLSLADTSTRSSGLPITPTGPVTTDIPAGSTRTVKFRTTTSLNQGAGICLCHDAVYPIDISVHQITSGNDTLVGSTRTYTPSFDVPPTKLAVSWVWPLIDRPHRLADGTVFLDDSLTDSVGGGRLDRSLQVLEQVADKVPMTVVIDPELIDELAVMATGKYTVQETGGRTVAGVGQQAAQSWLARLRALVTDHPTMALDLTPYADPDVQSLTERRLPWTSTMPTAMAVRVSAALGDRAADTSLAWPAGGRIDDRALGALTRTGVDTVLLDARAAQPSTQAGSPLSLASAAGERRSARLVLTSPALQGDVAASVSQTAPDPTKLPLLVAELAARVAQAPTAPHAVVLTPPRYVNPSPQLAAATIEDTVATPFSKPVTLTSLLHATSFPSPKVALRSVPSRVPGLTATQLDRAHMVHEALPAISTMLSRSVAGQAVASGLSPALQRIESAAWRTDGVTGGRRTGASVSAQLSGQVNSILSGVQIVNPKYGSYTLAGSNSPIPITVRNTLAYPVAVNITVTTVGNLPGLTLKTPKVQVIAASSKQTVQVPTVVQRSGRIPVNAVLSAPNDYQLGSPVKLFIHSTVLGTIGIVITVVAGVVLLVALLVRYIRRIRRIRSRRRGPGRTANHPGRTLPRREPVT